MNNNLVVFFSATGVTKKAALKLATEIKADVFEIVPKNKYTDTDLDWHDSNCRTSLEIKDTNLRPEIEEISINIDNYYTLYVGFPIWWDMAPNVIKTFLDKINKDNKRIIIFCTSGGSSLQPAVDDLRRTYPNIQIEMGERY